MKLSSSQQASQLLRGLRLHAKMSVAGFAQRVGIAETTVYERERGAAKSLSIDALITAADVFGMDVVLIRRDTGRPA